MSSRTRVRIDRRMIAILVAVLAPVGLFIAALGTALLLCITIIGIPFVIQAWKIGVLGLWPFGREVISD